jgi:hypothetical protein
MVTAILIIIGLIGLGCLVARVYVNVKDSNTQDERDRRALERGADVNILKAGQIRRNAEANAEKDLALVQRMDASNHLAHEPELIEERHKLTIRGFRMAEVVDANTKAAHEAATAKGQTLYFYESQTEKDGDVDRKIREITTLEEHKVKMEFEAQMNTIKAILAYLTSSPTEVHL